MIPFLSTDSLFSSIDYSVSFIAVIIFTFSGQTETLAATYQIGFSRMSNFAQQVMKYYQTVAATDNNSPFIRTAIGTGNLA